RGLWILILRLSGAPDVYLRDMPVQQEQEARWTIVPVLETVGRAIRRGFQCLRSIFVDDRVRRRNRSPELERGELWSGRRLVAQSIRTYGATVRPSPVPAPVPVPAPPAAVPSYGSAETVYVECHSEV
ncbi:hypothetical protein PRIPAC_96302, partial [Pristionchus pacificus]|uniref:Uncharacterized protein n=1 Tax=Pristionchus pacificus TaxID=54126 RepID=A0A2A6BC09_PRIPA